MELTNYSRKICEYIKKDLIEKFSPFVNLKSIITQLVKPEITQTWLILIEYCFKKLISVL